MGFYEIIADSTDGNDVLSKKRLIGHINSEQIGGKYVYFIKFKDNFADNQSVNNCLVKSVTNSGSESDFRQQFNIDFNFEDIEHQIINYDIDCDISGDKESSEVVNVSHESSGGTLNGETSDDTPQDMATNGTNECDNELGIFGDMSSEVINRRFACRWPQCLKRFSKKTGLVIHMRTHTGERPYRCDWPGCTKSFTQSGVLKNHKRIHTGERPYACVLCGQRFRTGAALHHHRNNHGMKRKKSVKQYLKKKTKIMKTDNESESNNESSFETLDGQSSVGRRASGKTILTSQASGSSPEKNGYECGFGDCGQRFARKSALINHLNKRHSDLYY